MSDTYVKKIAPLERKIYKLKRKAKDLQAEQEQLAVRLDALDLLAQHQDIVARKMDRFLHGSASEDMVKLETVEGQQLQQLAVDILSHFKQISIVYGRYKLAQESQEAQHLMDQVVASFMHMLKAVYFLHPELIFSLKDVNLLTGRYDPPGPQHWRAAMAGVGLSSQQIKVIKQVLDVVKVQMQQLEDERRELAAVIDAVKQLSLTTAGRVEMTNAEDEYVNTAAGDEAVPVACTALAVEEVIKVKGSGLLSSGTIEATSVPPTLAPGVPNQCEPSSASGSFLTASISQEVKIPLLFNDTLDQLGGTFNRWRMLSGARSASTYVWRAEQLAVVILACFPYMPMAAVLCDYLPE
eukprot:gene7051-7265_t